MSRAKCVKVAWTDFDIWSEARQLGLKLSRDQREEILDELEDQLKEAMIEAGWLIIREKLRQLKDESHV